MTPSSRRKAVPAKKAAVSSGRSTGKVTSTARSAPVLEAVAPAWALGGDVLTTATGTPVDDTDNSLRLGARGPTLLDDFHLREKIMHFDHERIPERVVHARGAAAHGHFRLTKSLGHVTKAAVLSDTGADVPVFVRFSTVAGSRGSADTARDVRGFAVRFYTEEGNWDLVGNNMAVFFIQDGIKFPDLIHAAKPEPDREIPQAQTAHDTFWDFASLTPETAHMLMWVMSDRAIPRSFRTMEGFGVHTFRLVNAKGATTLVKFHWKPRAGVHSLVWEEAQKLGGIDPDFHRRDLWEAIDAGNFPQWDLGVQLIKDAEDQVFEGIDLLDPTKLVPEELVPVTIVGTLTLDRNPDNFFAETEQVAFCTTHVPPGVDFTDDPLLQARNFSYLDTQLTRLGGPNFDQLPINRPRAAVNTTQRDGYGQAAVHPSRAAYTPNSIGGGCPFTAGESAWVAVPRSMDGIRARARAESFGDHFSQATMFWESMSPPEREHIVGAFSFELSKCERPEIR
jgi:catalase